MIKERKRIEGLEREQFNWDRMDNLERREEVKK